MKLSVRGPIPNSSAQHAASKPTERKWPILLYLSRAEAGGRYFEGEFVDMEQENSGRLSNRRVWEGF